MRKALIPSTLLIAALLSGCAATTTRQNAATGEQEMNATTRGALIGGIGGAILGKIAGGDSKDALIGGALGAGIGAGVGYHLDQQEADLRRELTGTGVQVVRNGNDLRLVMANGIGFATGDAILDAGIKPALRSVALVLDRYPQTDILIIGHTDSVGSDSHNQFLSQARAQAVSAELRYQGVDAARLISQGVGERQPKCDNDTATGRACNRRVELQLIQAART